MGNASLKRLAEKQVQATLYQIETDRVLAGKFGPENYSLVIRKIYEKGRLAWRDFFSSPYKETLPMESDSSKKNENCRRGFGFVTAVVVAVVIAVLSDRVIGLLNHRAQLTRQVNNLYRTIDFNGHVFVNNDGLLRHDLSTADVVGLPMPIPMLEQAIVGEIRDELQNKLGVAQMVYIKSYNDVVQFYNEKLAQYSTALSGGDRQSIEKIWKELGNLSHSLQDSSQNSRINLISDNECILLLLHKAYGIQDNNRKTKREICPPDALQRIRYWYGDYPNDTPVWLKEMYK